MIHQGGTKGILEQGLTVVVLNLTELPTSLPANQQQLDEAEPAWPLAYPSCWEMWQPYRSRNLGCVQRSTACKLTVRRSDESAIGYLKAHS